MTSIRILADDLTGALDSAAAFGCEVPVFLDGPPPHGALSPVSAVATSTRDVEPAAMAKRLDTLLPWLKSGTVAFKKVDSLVRGNTFVETVHVARTGGFRRVAFAPAFPHQGRLTIGGRQELHGADDPASAVADQDGIWLTERFAALGVPTVQRLDDQVGELSVWIPDVRDDGDLMKIASHAREAGREILWAGSAGLAHALARTCGFEVPAQQVCLPPLSAGPVMLVSASHHSVTRDQWDILAARQPHSVEVRRSQEDQLRVALAAIATRFELALFDLAPESAIQPEDAADLLTQRLKSIVADALRPAALLVVGGDTLRAVCGAVGSRELRASASIRIGWGCARLVGGRWDGVPCFSRSGAFGGPDDLLTMTQLVIERTATTRTEAC